MTSADRERVAKLLEKLGGNAGDDKYKKLQDFVTDLIYKNPLKNNFYKAPGVDATFNASSLREMHAKRIAGHIKVIVKLRFMPVLCIRTRRILEKNCLDSKIEINTSLLDSLSRYIAAFIMGRKGNPKKSSHQGGIPFYNK